MIVNGATRALLLTAEKVTRYSGGGAIGTVTGSGTLYVYDDRLEFFKKTGDQRSFLLGPLAGLALSMRDAKKNLVDTYYYGDIASARTGKYAGIMSTVVVTLRTGKSHSFTIGKGGAEFAGEICSAISQYLR